AAARRTRDLWFGSRLLSELSRAAAQAVKDAGGELIFPADLEVPADRKTSGVANVILAELPENDPARVAADAKGAVGRKWGEFRDEAYNAVSACIRKKIWDDQADDVIEFYAAWVTRSNDYQADRARVMRLLAGRKNCRDFLPAKGWPGVPKSSLDGRRESVLKDLRVERIPERERRLLRLRDGEQLDVVGVVKRVWGGNRPYPSVSRVAADPWVRGNQHRSAFQDLIEVCKGFPDDVLHGLSTKVFPQYRSFPFEGSAVYRSRFHEFRQEAAVSEQEVARLAETLERLPEPEPYVAVLVADGDRMGELIADLKSPDDHRAFSRSLASFAQKADDIVMEHYGFLVYAGGDDVLAFLPVDQCLACAAALREAFLESLKAYPKASLSVGIAVGHFMENLEDLLEYGRAAEKAAKDPDRDGLAVHLYKRGGAPIRTRARWTKPPQEQPQQKPQQQPQEPPHERPHELPHKRLHRLAELLLTDVIPSKLPYELRRLADLYADWPEPDETVASAMRADVLRILEKKKSGKGPGEVRAALEDLVKELSRPADLRGLAENMLVARQLTRAFKQAASAPAHADPQEVHE
ncbi:MAG: type III-B CRISPR-associated protein Cas10/Cmr2, partial [Thermogutta sp.]|nr:type III-B CRISPR-associated protein Cas10/Cmr2 [Thermogutta sp.]